ncbi:hypothetical protein GBA52_026243 [Prunus armeniaca]|nr:hypothetical protein GBA52_026243 [Prunus armeniaca]
MAAIAPSSSSLSNPSPLPSSTNSQNNTSRFTPPLFPYSKATSTGSITTTPITTTSDPQTFISRYAPDEPRKGADVLVEALERQGVTDVFAYPGGASMEIHQALTRSSTIRNVLPRHEQGGVFAAEATRAPPASLVSVLLPRALVPLTWSVASPDALLDSVPVVAITDRSPPHPSAPTPFKRHHR